MATFSLVLISDFINPIKFSVKIDISPKLVKMIFQKFLYCHDNYGDSQKINFYFHLQKRLSKKFT